MDEFMTVKRRLYEILEVSQKGDKTSRAYDIMILTCVAVGLVPLTIKGSSYYTHLIDIVTVCIFAADYILRMYTSDYKMGIKSYKAYLANAVMPMSIVDFLSITPVLVILFPASKTIALFRLFRVVLLFKVMRYSKTLEIIVKVVKDAWRPLSAVLTLAFVYIVSCALIIYQIEPEIFHNFMDAIYWSGCTVLTVGYGDIAPKTDMGRFLSVLSAMVGVAVIALPSGIVTAAYMNEIKSLHKKSW